ncbi:hypothetical protein IEQ44_04115 [Nocardioides sp. Y6]|uniref:DUF4386 family protein n=1 Tax=Nocardioides malaquae TaxID=2773426 RepID=A0ABR9RQI7_9ACTN|nr:hypothetical protein [Nocardioides malaquae]MBE7323833.1 hypothetical protein [Nocardioides malaquae]
MQTTDPGSPVDPSTTPPAHAAALPAVPSSGATGSAGPATRVALTMAALSLAAYPVLRPYGPETGPEGAADLASQAWVASHLFGMVGFVALAVALRTGTGRSPFWVGPWAGQPTRNAAWARATETRGWLAAVLLLPYYGAEAYGLQAVAQHAVGTGRWDVLEVADSFRYAPVPITTFTLGLLALVLVGGRLVHGLWAAGTTVRAGAVLACVTLATYLPQFFLPPAGRIAHGLVLAAGLLLVAYGPRRR